MKIKIITGIFLLSLTTFAIAQDAPKPKANIKTTKLSADVVAISCRDGQIPHLSEPGNGIFLISCAAPTK
jgi:hypothetical protein